jgi:putative nucleotidyltransferase-like protein
VEAWVLASLGRFQKGLGPAAKGWLDALRQRVAAATVDNLRRDAELADALDRLEGEGIDLILLKGSALRLEAPGRAGRFQCDVDALIRREDLERAEALLLGLGFRLDDSYLERGELLRQHFHFGFERRGAVLELHWDLDHPSPPGFVERLWVASREIDRNGRRAQVLSPEHQLLFGCLHLSRHAFHAGLRWLADLRLHLAAGGVDRETFLEEARGWPRRAVSCPLWLLAEVGVEEARELGGDGGADPFERLLLRRLTGPLLVAEPWLGLPAWRVENALRAWLFSEGSLPGLLARASGEGLSGRLRSWAAGAVRETV